MRRELDPAKATGFPAAMRVAEHRRPEWAKDGSIVYVGLRPRERATRGADSTVAAVRQRQRRRRGAQLAATPRRAKSDDKPSDVQVWHAKDVRIMPMQKVQEQQDLQRTLLTAWHLARRPRRADRHGSPRDDARAPRRSLRDGDGSQAIRVRREVRPAVQRRVRRRREERRATQGAREGALLLRRQRNRPKLAWYDGKDYWARTSRRVRERTSRPSFRRSSADPDYDYPSDMKPPADFQGWAKDDRAVLVADEYDVWSLNPDGSGGRRLTNWRSRPDRPPIRPHVAPRRRRHRPREPGLRLAVRQAHEAERLRAACAPATVERLVFDDASVNRLARADSHGRVRVHARAVRRFARLVRRRRRSAAAHARSRRRIRSRRTTRGDARSS